MGTSIACDKCKGLVQTDWISHVSIKVIDGEITCFVLISPETQRLSSQQLMSHFKLKEKGNHTFLFKSMLAHKEMA